jgi:hypothetical protein
MQAETMPATAMKPIRPSGSPVAEACSATMPASPPRTATAPKTTTTLPVSPLRPRPQRSASGRPQPACWNE